MSLRGNYQKILFVGIIVCVCLGSPCFVCAGERTLVDGIVHATEDLSGNLIEVKLTLLNLMEENEFFYKIVLDENGKKLGKEMNGKWVEVIGEITKTDDIYWLEVKSYTYFDHKSDNSES